MCVIMCFEDKFPILENLEEAERMNQDGSGMSWIENGKVHYVKGFIKAKDLFKMIEDKNIQLPIIIHFRIKSSGIITESLSHPFEVGLRPKNKEDGICSKVLFHNGTLTDWKEDLMNLCINQGIKIPNGDLSDSRALSYHVYYMGDNYLRLIDGGKYTLMDKNGIRRFGEFQDIKGAQCSNHSPNIIKTTTGWNSDYDGEYESFYEKQQREKKEREKRIEDMKDVSKKLTLKKFKKCDISKMTEKQKQDYYVILQKDLDKLDCKIYALEINLIDYNEEIPVNVVETAKLNVKISKTTTRIDEAKDIKKDLTKELEDLFQNSKIPAYNMNDYCSIFFNSRDDYLI